MHDGSVSFQGQRAKFVFFPGLASDELARVTLSIKAVAKRKGSRKLSHSQAALDPKVCNLFANYFRVTLSIYI